jgi:hypothetical protein
VQSGFPAEVIIMTTKVSLLLKKKILSMSMSLDFAWKLVFNFSRNIFKDLSNEHLSPLFVHLGTQLRKVVHSPSIYIFRESIFPILL